MINVLKARKLINLRWFDKRMLNHVAMQGKLSIELYSIEGYTIF